MKLLRSTMILMLMLGMVFSIAACSGTGPVDPDTNMPASFGIASEEGRTMIAAYQINIDPVAETCSLTTVDRVGSYHFPISDLKNVLSITGFGWTPNFWADIKLQHPYPGSGIDGYDARAIAVLPARAGVSMGYPGLGVLANNSVLLEPDGYTDLWDKGLDGNVNPFVSYFKSQPFRVWSSTGVTQETLRWQMDITGFGGGGFSFILVVDVSTNFPAAPSPITDNVIEPAEITEAIVGSGLSPTGGNASVDITVLDWQGTGQPINVSIEGPDLFTGVTSLSYSGPHPTEPNQFIFSGTISNDLGAPIGDYWLLAAAEDDSTGRVIYEEFMATVEEGPGPGAWALDSTRGNVDMTVFEQYPAPGTDICVIDSGIPDWDGVLLYDEFHQVVRADLGLTDGVFYGYGYLPWDEDPENPHPAPEDPMPAGRIDGADNGYVFRTWVDPHQGLGPDQNGNYQRCDCAIGYFMPLAGILDNIAVAYIALSDEYVTERPRGSDVWDESDNGAFTFPLGSFWAGTVMMDDTQTWYKVGLMGANAAPYFDGTNFVTDWGLWRVTNPPMNEIVGMDASQDPIFPMQYWAYNGPGTGGSIVAWYDKDAVAFLDAYIPSDDTAGILDIELIPLQSPPLDVDGKVQYNDWVAILLDNGTLEVFDPFIPDGELVDVINASELIGDVAYMDVDDSNADIFVTHTDGTLPYCSVFVIE